MIEVPSVHYTTAKSTRQTDLQSTLKDIEIKMMTVCSRLLEPSIHDSLQFKVHKVQDQMMNIITCSSTPNVLSSYFGLLHSLKT